MQITSIGLDLAKSIFHLVGFDRHQKEVFKKKLKRQQLLPYFAQLPPCLITMEACAGSNYWYQQLSALGHRVKLIAAQHVKAYLRGNKNDFNDARAIAEAAARPDMRFVSPKTLMQQELQALLQSRKLLIAQRTAVCNQVRGLLAEHGIVAPRGVATLRRALCDVLEDASNGLSPTLREILGWGYEQFQSLDQQLAIHDRKLTELSRENEAVKRLQSVPGYGVVLASAMVSAIGDGSAFRRGRDVAASVGVVPRQHSTGGKNILLGISKRGDRYLRSLLIHGARSVIQQAPRRDDRLSRWILEVCARRGKNKATVALANKLARIGWAVLRHQQPYEMTKA
jgi:transposase